MENSSQQDAEEIVAAGELFKQSTSGSKTWALRKFVLAGVYLIYFNRKGERKGQWSIMGCQVKRMTPEEVGTPAAKNAFALVGPKTTHVLCASSDKNRVAWINLISEQIIEFKDILRRFLNTGESIVGNSQVRKKGLFGFSSNMRVLLTNLPRLIVIDQTAEVLNDQMSWDKQCPPTFTRLGENRFKVQLERKEFTFEDADNGAKYWEEVFRRLPVMNYFVPKRRASMVVDFQDREGGDYFTERVRLDSLIDGAEPSGKNRRMTAGAADEAGNNVRFLQDALSNINELVRALEEKISEIDETNAAAEKAGGLDDMSRQLRDDRKQKRSQLLMLKDNVAVLSTNLQTLVTRSTEDGTTNFDVDAIESVISETAAMLVMLSRETEVGNYDPASEPIEPLEIEEPKVALEVELKKIDEFVAKVDEESTAVNKMVASIEFTGDDKDDLIEEMIATFDGIDVSEDIPITPSNFDAGDPIKRPSNWKDIRMKRILIKELVSRLEGIPEKAITDTRKAKVLEEEAIMTEEVVSNGRLLNMESLRNWKSLLQAAVAVTPDNYAEKDKTKRPLAWQAIRFKRVVQREEIARRERGTSEAAILKGRTNKIIREEKLMKREVAAHGQILHFGGLDLENIVVQDLDQSPTYTASKIANRAKGWVLLRLKRVMIVEALERKAGKDEKTINEEQASKIVAEDALMLAESTQYGVALSIDEDFKFVTPKSSVWGEVALRRVMLRAEFLKLTTLRPAQLAAERKLMDNEILRYQQLLYVHLWKGGHNINVAQLKATADNFVPEDPAKRPEGWSDLKERRKYILEKAKKDDGMDEETIESMRPEKTADVSLFTSNPYYIFVI